MIRKKAAVQRRLCVACGCCVKACPKEAISVFKGLYAVVNPETCIGCGRCVKTCPAGVIALQEAEVTA